VVEGGGLENRFPVSGTGVRIPLPPPSRFRRGRRLPAILRSLGRFNPAQNMLKYARLSGARGEVLEWSIRIAC
jgi:hypothetical protein